MGRHKKLIDDISKLRTRADETILADEEKVNQTIKWIKDILYSNEDMIALAAPQIGVNSRLFCIKFNDGDIRTFINPMIVEETGKHFSIETCINLLGVEYIVPRYDTIKVNFQTPVGLIDTNIFEGVVSEVFQQMCQIIDGVFIDEIGLEVLDGWYESSDEEKQQIIEMWMNSIAEEATQLREEINNNQELLKIEKDIEFRTAVARGEVTLESTKQRANREERRIARRIERLLKKREEKKRARDKNGKTSN